ncbi:cystatin-like fold lipoprotein [Peribacillus frigoritolerans]
MKNKCLFMLFILMFVLTACGGNEHDNAIDSVVKQKRNLLNSMRDDVSDFTQNLSREDCTIEVYNEGKYIKVYYPLTDSVTKKPPHCINEELMKNIKKILSC